MRFVGAEDALMPREYSGQSCAERAGEKMSALTTSLKALDVARSVS